MFSNIRNPQRDCSIDNSLWHHSAQNLMEYPTLRTTQKVDVAVIGGGYTGLSSALHLAHHGYNISLIEAKEIGNGASGRNVGFVNPGLWLDPDTIQQRSGDDILTEELSHSPQLVYNLIEQYNIDCELSEKSVLRLSHSNSMNRYLQRNIDQWNQRGVNEIEWIDRRRVTELTASNLYHGGLIDHRSRTINPMGYARGLAMAASNEGASIYTNSPAIRIVKDNNLWRVISQDGELIANNVIIATDAYSQGLWPGLSQNLIPVGCFCYSSTPLTESQNEQALPSGHGFYDTQNAMLFARKDANNRLLIGSLGYLPPEDHSDGNSFANRALRKMFPNLEGVEWERGWHGNISYTDDNLPRFIQLDRNVFTVLGYNGRGIGPGTYFGRYLANNIMQRNEVKTLPTTSLQTTKFRNFKGAVYQSLFNIARSII